MAEHLPNSLNTSNTEFTHFSAKRGNKFCLVDRDPIAEEETIAQLLSLRTSILELPTNTKDLNMERVQESLKFFNASKKPLQFLDSTHFSEALARANSKSSEPSGIYMESLGVSLVRRNLALEALNGTAITESFAIHEGAHSTHIKTPLRLIRSKYGIWKKPEISVSTTPRVFKMTPEESLVPGFGSLFEEGYAELERGLFVQRHYLVEDFTKDAENLDYFSNSPIPLHYMYKTPRIESGQEPILTFAPGAIAAAIFEILIRQNDTLLPILRKSRHEDDGLRQTQELIDTEMPGLYKKLQQPNQGAIASVLGEVIKKFGLPR